MQMGKIRIMNHERCKFAIGDIICDVHGIERHKVRSQDDLDLVHRLVIRS